MDEYSFSTDIDVHLRDIDRLHHVNNAVLVSYLQQARVEYLDELVDYLDSDTYVVVAAHEMEFHHPVSWGDTLTIELRVTEIGSSSFTIEYRGRVGETTCITAETPLVTFDRDAQGSVPLPKRWRERLRSDNAEFLD